MCYSASSIKSLLDQGLERRQTDRDGLLHKSGRSVALSNEIVEGMNSTWCVIPSGVPHGSLMGSSLQNFQW